MSIAVLTRAYGNGRDGANTEETLLTAAAVGRRGIKRLFSLQLPGDRRGAEAQPLIVPAVRLPNGQTRDLVLIATMANRIFAFDANDGTPVWDRLLGTPINGSGDIDAHLSNDHWGIQEGVLNLPKEIKDLKEIETTDTGCVRLVSGENKRGRAIWRKSI